MLDLADIFGHGGPLERALPAFKVRRQQLRMAERVAAAIEGRETLAVEAGTGTGKTFAYLVPALLSGARVLISTGTRTLQDQLFSKDLPLLAAAIGRPANDGRMRLVGHRRLRFRVVGVELGPHRRRPVRTENAAGDGHHFRRGGRYHSGILRGRGLGRLVGVGR